MADIALAIATVEAVKRKLDEAAGPDPIRSYDEWKARRLAAEKAGTAILEAAGARVKVDWQGALVGFAGIRATSTGGLQGAINNWLRRAHIHGGARG